MAQMAVCHVQKCSGKCSSHMEAEEERLNKNTPNADKKRKHLNHSIHLNEKKEAVFDQLKWSEKTKQERIDDRLATQKSITIIDKNGRKYIKTAKIRRDAVTHFNLILGGSHERLDELFQESRKMFESGVPMRNTPIGMWAMDNYLWLAERAGGAENIVTFCLHLDETTPHIQATICPMYDGRLNSKKFIDGPFGLKRFQTEYAENVSKKWGLERGIEGSKAKHSTLSEFYRRLEEASRTPGDAKTIEIDVKQFEKEAPQISTRPPIIGKDKWMEEENERLARQHQKNQKEIIEKILEMLKLQVENDNHHFYEIQNTAIKMIQQNYRLLSKNGQLKGQIDAIAEFRANEISAGVRAKAKEEIERLKNETEEEIDRIMRDTKDTIEAEVHNRIHDLFFPTFKQVWAFVDQINGEKTNLEDFESWDDCLNGLISKMTQANDFLKKEKENAEKRGVKDYQKKIYPLLKQIWSNLDDISGTHPDFPRKTTDILKGISDRLETLDSEILPQIINVAVEKAMKEYVEEKIRPQNERIRKLEEDSERQKKEINTLCEEQKRNRKMLSIFAKGNPIVQAGRKAIHDAATTTVQKWFTPEQAEKIVSAISLGDNQTSQKSIAEWLLTNVYEEIKQSSTYLSWFQKFVEPQTTEILNSLLDMGDSKGVGVSGGIVKDLSKKKKKKNYEGGGVSY